MEQFEQLLTCAICLDRYRNPKLLPCQHSFCMEPCMDGLVDYVRRQVKCPECRAEHRIPYQGVQGYPTNVTLQRFLELHIEITGEIPDPTSGQIMKRCAVCTEKNYCVHCSHCAKDVCGQCKSAHMDILRREIARINNQVRRALARLEETLSLAEKNSLSLQNNCSSVLEEVDEIYRRLSKALKDRNHYLRTEVERYLSVELKNLNTLKENLQTEISNIQSNCDLADRHMANEDVNWEDVELLDTKDIFLKTVEFIRNFEAEMGDYTRRVRFTMAHDPTQLVAHVSTFGELNISMPHQLLAASQAGSGPGLMRSKSDHRLAAQYRDDRYERGTDESGRLSPRKFGQRFRRDRDFDYEDEPRSAPRRTRSSRFRPTGEGTDSDNEPSSGRGVRFEDKPREKVLDTEELTRGPLSGIGRLADSPRVMTRLVEGKRQPQPQPQPQVPPPPPTAAQPKPQAKRQPPPPLAASRQISEEDEITKIKRQMKNAPGERSTPPERPPVERVSSLRRDEPSSPVLSEPQAQTGGGSQSSSDSSDESSHQAPTPSRKTSLGQQRPGSTAPARRTSDSPVTTPGRLTSSSTPTTGATGATGGGDEEESESSEESDSSEESSDEEAAGGATAPSGGGGGGGQQATADLARTDIGPLLARSAQARDDSRKSSRDETYSSPTRSRYAESSRDPPATSSPVAPWRTRTAHNNTSTEDESPSTSSRYGTATPTAEPKPAFTSRFLNKSKSAAVVSPEEEDPGLSRRFPSSSSQPSSAASSAASSRSRYSAIKDRKSRLARSKSTHNIADDDEDDEPMTPSAYLASRYGPGATLAKSRSSHAIKSRETSPEQGGSSGGASGGGGSGGGPPGGAGAGVGEKDGAALSSWARYLKNKYGNRAGSTAASNSRRLSLGLPLRQDPEEEAKNTRGSPTSPTQHAFHQGFGVDTSTKSKYLNKRRQVFSLGSRGSEPGCFTWPRGVATGPGDIIAVADSSNHRVQVFDSNGIFQKEFGSYGNGEGEFDCLAGVAINRIGQFIIADRYNHRIQVMDPSGRFLRAFGSQGTADGKFNYPWGVTTDALGFIYVCDKENHRVQVFQSDGTFVGKFGSQGRGSGQLDHPHYIAVSNTNRVIVSDSNNHRLQVFDVNGRPISSIGSEGSDDGQFKFPRGVGVDDQGYIVVGDSGNNRLQIFSPEGVFLRGFGSWGSGEGEFKGLEGVAVTSTNNILACDRENHRLQVF